MNKTNIQSYYHFMHENLFNHVDILKENINIPSGQFLKMNYTNIAPIMK